MPDGSQITLYEITASGPSGVVFSSDDYDVIETRECLFEMLDHCLGEQTVTVTLNGTDITKQALREFAERYTKACEGDVSLDNQSGAFMDAFDAAIFDYNFPEVAV